MLNGINISAGKFWQIMKLFKVFKRKISPVFFKKGPIGFIDIKLQLKNQEAS